LDPSLNVILDVNYKECVWFFGRQTALMYDPKYKITSSEAILGRTRGQAVTGETLILKTKV